MSILSKRVMNEVGKSYRKEYGLSAMFMGLTGESDNLVGSSSRLPGSARKRNYALQESINLGTAYVFSPASSIVSWVVGLENMRMVHGALISGEVRLESGGDESEALDYLYDCGMDRESAEKIYGNMPVFSDDKVSNAAKSLYDLFYGVSGWEPELMKENRRRELQKHQITQSIEEQRKHGIPALYAFEKERILLGCIRAGDRNGAREILNDMLSTIYLSSPGLVVLRARVIELVSCLTRAAIEDNPLMEPLIERNHAWIERLITAGSFEELSGVLMETLDDFVDAVYLHGINRSNVSVSRALDFISTNYMKKISLKEVARDVGLSSSRLSHLIKDYTGKTVLQHIQQVRVQNAQRMLERSDSDCSEIAYEVGFSDQSYFTKHFKKIIGKTPGQYRRAVRGRL